MHSVYVTNVSVKVTNLVKGHSVTAEDTGGERGALAGGGHKKWEGHLFC